MLRFDLRKLGVIQCYHERFRGRETVFFYGISTALASLSMLRTVLRMVLVVAILSMNGALMENVDHGLRSQSILYM